MDLDEQAWQFFKDHNQRIENAAKEAMRRIGWSDTILWARLAQRRGAGMLNADCAEVWCVKLASIEPEVRHCLSIHDSDNDMVNKFVQTFDALKP